jgi:biotin operon repressor
MEKSEYITIPQLAKILGISRIDVLKQLGRE